jgi:hypothetical protein
MGDLESVLAVRSPFIPETYYSVANDDGDFLEDFAMLEASYALVRLIQRYPYCEVPEGDSGAGVGDEEQLLTLTMSSGEGCWVRMRSKRNADQEIFSAMANIV